MDNCGWFPDRRFRRRARVVKARAVKVRAVEEVRVDKVANTVRVARARVARIRVARIRVARVRVVTAARGTRVAREIKAARAAGADAVAAMRISEFPRLGRLMCAEALPFRSLALLYDSRLRLGEVQGAASRSFIVPPGKAKPFRTSADKATN